MTRAAGDDIDAPVGTDAMVDGGTDKPLAQGAYIKASNTGSLDHFGFAVA